VAAAALAGRAGGAFEASLLESRLVVWGFTQGETLRQPRGIAFDPRDGAIYVANTGQHRIEVFSRTGRPLARFVHSVTQPDSSLRDGAPCVLAFDAAGHLLVADQAVTYVDVLDRRGRSLTHLVIPSGQPTALAVSVDGIIYVGTAAEQSRIYRFRTNYAPAGSWGEAGSEPGHLKDVTAIAELPDSTIAVACARTDLGIQIFSAAGDYLRGFGTHELGEGNVSLPSGLVGSPDGRIWVVDEIRQELLIFDRAGKFLAAVGGRGAEAGEFAHPSSLASDGKGLIAVTDRELGRFQVLAIPTWGAADSGK
jgi:DNA-binding beta-propeller fold protein YncE